MSRTISPSGGQSESWHATTDDLMILYINLVIYLLKTNVVLLRGR